ncbi:hypothetical protein [Ramlibacter tataouinensis]|uniref:Secreted protein n=1 Tax=Ramlibacter tataouinensis (strain ATCC BAA-407 / DSM 14655 / LMG 21543 / TTB310) TaxID=365046 RepID=F5Y054_RAMTT|nr:hypothetical protein [Ramlibacter tataouinensis]AEG94603.1 hypothetical protein Rta_34900 [Ramlibacter tataouinensis TTB310]
MTHATGRPTARAQALLPSLALAAAAFLASAAALAEAPRAAFGVTIHLRTFSETPVSDHRCTHRGGTGADTVRLSCPATVDVQAIANTAAGWKMQQQPLQGAGAYKGNRYEFTAAADPMPRTSAPMELLITW